MANNLRPINGRALMRRDPKPEKRGLIWLPGKYQIYGWSGTIEAVCKTLDNVKDGDRVLCLKDATVLPWTYDRALSLVDGKGIMAKLIIDGKVEKTVPVNDFVIAAPFRKENISQNENAAANDATRIEYGMIEQTGEKVSTDLRIGDFILFIRKHATVIVENSIHKFVMREQDILARECRNA